MCHPVPLLVALAVALAACGPTLPLDTAGGAEVLKGPAPKLVPLDPVLAAAAEPALLTEGGQAAIAARGAALRRRAAAMTAAPVAGQ